MRRRTPPSRLRRRPGAASPAELRVHGPAAPKAIGCAVITVSDTRRGADDLSGAAIVRMLGAAGHRVVSRAWVADDPRAIRRAAKAALAPEPVDVLIVTGGTGIAPRDCTPDALTPLVGRWLPGFGERFRAASETQVGSAAWLSRAEAGLIGDRLVFLLPGSTRAVELALERLILPELGHAVRLIARIPEEE